MGETSPARGEPADPIRWRTIMFLSTTTAKKLLKKAFNNHGLRVAVRQDLLYVAGSGWEAEMVSDTAPYKLKAAIVELCGRLPDVYEQFLATKDGMQEELLSGESLYDRYKNAKKLLDETPVIIDKKYHMYKLFQHRGDRDFTLIDMERLALIDIREVDMEQGEGIPSGPCSETEHWKAPVFWHSACGTLCLHPSEGETDLDDEILDALKTIEFVGGKE